MWRSYEDREVDTAFPNVGSSSPLGLLTVHSFCIVIEEDSVIERILRHSCVPSRHAPFGRLRRALRASLRSECNLWKDLSSRGPPGEKPPPEPEEVPLDYGFFDRDSTVDISE